MSRPACSHAHGEYSDTYQHCFDCGLELMLISGDWFYVEGWIRISEKLIEEAEQETS